jgi:hypothetical protein
MIARESPSLHPAPFYASGESSAKSNYSRTYEPFSRNSNYSRTYAIPGGGGIYQFLCQTNSSRSFYPDAALWIQVFAHSFIFWITAIPRSPHKLRTLLQKTGVHPLVIPIIKPSPPSIPQALRPPLRSALCVLCVSAVSLLLFPFAPLAAPPCPSSSFPLQWGYPFPVTTGENQ